MYAQKGKYLQHSVREGGRVTTRYYGNSDAGRLIADMSAELRREEADLKRERSEHRKATAASVAAEKRAGRVRASLASEALEAVAALEGIRRHQRNHWVEMKGAAMAARQIEGPRLTEEEATAEVKRLFAYIRKADMADQQGSVAGHHRRMKEIAAIHPHVVLAITKADMADMAVRCAGKAWSALSAVWEGIEVQLEFVRDDLVGDSDSRALRMAAEVAAMAYAEFWFSQMWNVTYGVNEAKQRHVTYAQKRLLAALKACEEIRAIGRRKRSVTFTED